MFSGRKDRGGFTLIETLVGSVVFALVALSAYQAFSTLMDAVLASRAKIAAASLANEQFEIIRNLSYDDVGVASGIPVGKIPREQNITRDGFQFEVLATIRNTDDPFDGTIGGIPLDSSPADYKSVDLDIDCGNCKVFPTLRFTTLVAPYALETASTNGALFIQVIDVEGVPIAGADIHIANTQADPDIVIDEITDNDGWVKIIDAPPGVNAYNIAATKEGFTTDETYPLGGVAGDEPINADATVVLQTVTQTSLSIDQESSLAVNSVDESCMALADIDFSMTGTKLIGTPNVVKFPTQNFATDVNGIADLDGLEWDIYVLVVTEAGFDLAGTSIFPHLTISPNQNLDTNIVIVPHSEKALLVSVQDDNGNPLDGASVQLDKVGFSSTKVTSAGGVCPTPGQVFWNGLEDGNYTLTVSKAGYQDTTVPDFPLASWQHQNITLTP